jgi:endonuclease IV
MKASMKKVLTALKKAKKTGITFKNFHTGFQLGARIAELRNEGYNITTRMEPNPEGRSRGRYLLA